MTRAGSTFFFDRLVNFARRFCCHKKVSITYRGSTYENSWETRFCTAGTLRSDPRRLRQSAATPTAIATAGKNLRDHG
jgi:hypothetical protein